MGENVGKLLPYSMYCTQTQDFEKKILHLTINSKIAFLNLNLNFNLQA